MGVETTKDRMVGWGDREWKDDLRRSKDSETPGIPKVNLTLCPLADRSTGYT